MRTVSDLAVAASSATIGALVPLLLRLDLPRLESVLRPRRSKPRPSEARLDELVWLADAGRHRAGRLVRPGCLSRGITRWVVLAHAGSEVDLVFGFGHPEPDAPAGHCWLERGGQPFLESTDPRPVFTEIYRMRSEPGRP